WVGRMGYGVGPKSFSLIAMPAIRASRTPVVISRTAVWTAVCFARRKPASNERRSRMSSAASWPSRPTSCRARRAPVSAARASRASNSVSDMRNCSFACGGVIAVLPESLVLARGFAGGRSGRDTGLAQHGDEAAAALHVGGGADVVDHAGTGIDQAPGGGDTSGPGRGLPVAGTSGDALIHLDQLLDLDKSDPVLLLSFAELTLDQPNPEHLRRTAELSASVENETPVHTALLLYRARALVSLGLPDAAIDVLMLAPRPAPQSTGPKRIRAQLCRGSGV